LKELTPIEQNVPDDEINRQSPSVRNSDQMHCFSCAKLLHVSSQFCPSCGASQPQNTNIKPGHSLQNENNRISDQTYCRGCGEPIHKSAMSCPSCGAVQTAKRHGSKSRTTAIILALFLGGFGIHKFYLDQIILGMIYLLFFWTFIPAIIAFLEAIVYITYSDEKFTQIYG